MSGFDSGIPERSLNTHGSDALGRQASLNIAAVDMVSRQIAIAVGRPGEIDGAGGRIGNRDQPLGNGRGKVVFGRNLDGLAGLTLYLHGLTGELEVATRSST